MKLTITTLVIVEGSYIQGMENSLEEHPGKAYQELIPEHLHMINALKEIQNYWDLTSEKVIITDIIPIPQP